MYTHSLTNKQTNKQTNYMEQSPS